MPGNLDFELALKRLSRSQLKRMGVLLGVDTKPCTHKGDYVDVLSNVSRAKQIELMRGSILLAGKTSSYLFQHITKNWDPDLEPAKFNEATAVPQIVHVGKVSEIAEGKIYVAWAMLDSDNAYIDPNLTLKVLPEALVVDSFYDVNRRILEVRGSDSASRRISKVWAGPAGVDPDAALNLVGIPSVDDFHKFKKQIDGKTVKVRGRLLQSRGFDEVSAKKNDDIEDADGTPDYVDFLKNTTPTEFDLEIGVGEELVTLGVGLRRRMFVFRNMVTQQAMEYLYAEIMLFLGL